MANIQNILSQDLDVIPQGAGTIILRIKDSLKGQKGDTGPAGVAGRASSGGSGGSGGSVTAKPADETLLWLAL